MYRVFLHTSNGLYYRHNEDDNFTRFYHISEINDCPAKVFDWLDEVRKFIGKEIEKWTEIANFLVVNDENNVIHMVGNYGTAFAKELEKHTKGDL